MNMYCLFCQTQKSAQVAELIETMSDATSRIRCISPKIIQRCWVQGREEHRVHDYLPGYLFLYAEEPIEDFPKIQQLSGVLRILKGDTTKNAYELVGSDRIFARMLYEMDGTIGIMKTVRVGDRIQLDHRLYAGFTGEVVKVDKRKGRAKIVFEFDGSTQSVWVGYNEVEPMEAEPTGAKPKEAEPTGNKPTEAEPTGAEPSGVKPSGAEPTEDPGNDPPTNDEKPLNSNE